MSNRTENIRARLGRAIRFVSDANNFKTNTPDPDKLGRAVYTIIMNDVPQLLQSVEAYELVVREQRDYIAQLERKIHEDS